MRPIFLRAWGWGIDLQERKKLQSPWGVPGEGMVTSKIEPCIKKLFQIDVLKVIPGETWDDLLRMAIVLPKSQ